jgi:hypothetical protein
MLKVYCTGIYTRGQARAKGRSRREKSGEVGQKSGVVKSNSQVELRASKLC